MLVDSLAAWSVRWWLLRRQHHDRPLAAIIHQPPGGVAHGALRIPLQRRLDEAMYRRCDLLLVTSHGFARDLADRWHLPCERICVVEPGSDLPVAPPAAGEDLRQGRRIALLSVGNWSSNKGVLELLDAGRGPAGRPGHAPPGRTTRHRSALPPARGGATKRPGPARTSGGARSLDAGPGGPAVRRG